MLATPTKTFLALGITASLQSCCSLATLFCGPDRSEWVSESYRTPEAAVATFKEAARRADKGVIFSALSVGFLERHGIGSLEVATAWEALEKQAPLHMLGQAEVSGPTEEPDGRLCFLLTISGHELRLRVVKEDVWRVTYEGPDKSLRAPSRVVPDLTQLVEVESGSPPTDPIEIRLKLEQSELGKRGWRQFRKEALREISLAREWKIDDFEAVSAQPAPKGSGIDDQGG